MPGTGKEADVLRSLAALAQDVRLRTFRALVVADADGLTPTALCEQLDAAPNAMSSHLKELFHACLVTQERQGRNLIHHAAFGQRSALLACLTLNCCEGQPCELVQAPCAC